MDMSKMVSPKKEEKPRTIEELFVNEFMQLKKDFDNLSQHALKLAESHQALEDIMDTLKKHATLENGTVCIFIHSTNEEDRDFIVDALELKEKEKEEEKPNE